LLSALAFVYYATAAPVKTAEQKAKINCLIDHLKEQGKLGASVPKYTTESDADDHSSCASTIASIKREFLTLLISPVLDKISEQEKECIFNDAISDDFVYNAMLMTVYEEEGLFSETERAEKFKEARRKSLSSMFKPLFKCTSEQLAGSSFDDDIKSAKTTHNDEEFYCMKKFVVENNLIDTTVYDIAVTPKNPEFSGVDCDSFIKKMIDEGEKGPQNGLDEATEACFEEKIREVGIAQNKIVVKVLSKLDISDEQKQNERKKHIKLAREVSNKILACIP
jgi:hypothetical protein